MSLCRVWPADQRRRHGPLSSLLAPQQPIAPISQRHYRSLRAQGYMFGIKANPPGRRALLTKRELSVGLSPAGSAEDLPSQTAEKNEGGHGWGGSPGSGNARGAQFARRPCHPPFSPPPPALRVLVPVLGSFSLALGGQLRPEAGWGVGGGCWGSGWESPADLGTFRWRAVSAFFPDHVSFWEEAVGLMPPSSR